MISLSRARAEDPADRLDYLLRRAEQELIAAIRSINPQAVGTARANGSCL